MEIARELRRDRYQNVNQIARWCNKRTQVSQKELKKIAWGSWRNKKKSLNLRGEK
ncbi:plasmid mobilization relaxosome protein MobC (plasmid) [Bacillus toyonensis]